MTDNLEALQRRRAGYRTRASKAVDTASDTLQIDDRTTGQLQGQVDVLQRNLSTLEDLDLRILDLIGPDADEQDIENEVSEAGEHQDKLVSMIAVLIDDKKSRERENDVASTGSTTGSTTNQGQSGRSSDGAVARLPKLELPKFSGDPLKWSPFWDAFESSVHTSRNLSDVDKFNYLKSLLKGSALDSVSGLSVTNANYATAVQLIQERFGQKQIIISAHVEALVNLSKASSDTCRVRSLYDAAEIYICGLESLGITAAENGAILTPILLSKVPEDIRLIMTRRNDGPIVDLDVLRKLLRSEIEAREQSSVSNQQHQKESQPREHPRQFTASSFLNTSKPNSCKFCKDSGHNAIDCNTFKTVKDRRQQAFSLKLCLNCLNPNHRVVDCKSKGLCRQCNRKHHTSICEGSSSTSGSNYSGSNKSNVHLTNTEVSDEPAYGSVSTVSTVAKASAAIPLLANTSPVWMQTAVAKVMDSTGTPQTVRLLFDTASDRSYVTESMVKKLSLPSNTSEVLSITPFGQKKPGSKRYDVAKLQCTDFSGAGNYFLEAVVVPAITCPIYRASLKCGAGLQHLQLADPPMKNKQWLDIDILVGLDHYWELVRDQIVRLPEEGLIAVSSVFGWLVSGTLKNHAKSISVGNTLFTTTGKPDEDHFLTKFWESDSMEFVDCNSKAEESQKDIALQKFEESVEFNNGRYEVGLPWKIDASELPTNKFLCRNRFKGLVKRLNREELVQQYHEIIVDQLKNNFIEEVADPTVSSGVVHYLPHHPLIRKDHSTTKIRIVYDASAKKSAIHPSINDNLYSGPNLIADLMGILLKFRSYKIVLLADIEKAFLQIGLHKVDRDATRFFWLKDLTQPPTEDNIIVYRFCRIPFGATSSPFLLAATLQHHLKNSPTTAAKKMLNSFYVDNLVAGADDLEEANAFRVEAKQEMNDIGMNLREWNSNDKQFINSVPLVDRAVGTTCKVLGIPWNTEEDLIYVKAVQEMSSQKWTTKRQVLQAIAKVFDPFGLVSPVVIKAKIFIQHLWKLGFQWDDRLQQDLQAEWNVLNYQLSQLEVIKIPRHLKINAFAELHVFVDASSKGYAAVAYVRNQNDSSVQLVFSKSRVAPIKEITIPRLELMAAVMGCKVAEFIKSNFSAIGSVQVWSDSEVVLHWINSPSQKQGVFVSNRIKVIRDFNFSFRYVPSKENPADFPSRGIDVETLEKSIWLSGPTWLQDEPGVWPHNTIDKSFGDSEEQLAPTVGTSLVSKATVQFLQPPLGIDIRRFSTLTRLLRVTSLCLKFIQRMKKSVVPNTISVEELHRSKMKWIQHSQQVHFGDQMERMKTNKHDSVIRSLNLFLDNGIIRCKGRLSQAAVSEDTNTPVLLPKKDKLTDLIIVDQHCRQFHQGVRHTLCAMRQNYWIPNGRQQVRFVLKRCGICRHWDGCAYSLPPPPPLPNSRVTRNPAFTFSGCDFAGPMMVFNDKNNPKKVYICLFTCAVTRAIHLELVEDLTTHTFLMALRRFISRRGCAQEIISDNAKTFKLSKMVLDKLWHDVIISEDTVNYVAEQGIKWKFNVERAPWWGGFFEKMVGLTKRTLIKAIGKTQLTSTELATALSEVEAILNNRPLTYVYDQLEDGKPLRPSNFLSENSSFALPTVNENPDPDFNDPNPSVSTLLRKLQVRQKVLDRFWNCWLKEYLPSLREHHKATKGPRKNAYLPQIGDVVLIKQEGIKRANWRFGIIIQRYTSNLDGQIRAVQVKTSNKQVLQRPVSHLYPLELTTNESMRDQGNDDHGQEQQPAQRAKIKAPRPESNITPTEKYDSDSFDDEY